MNTSQVLNEKDETIKKLRGSAGDEAGEDVSKVRLCLSVSYSYTWFSKEKQVCISVYLTNKSCFKCTSLETHDLFDMSCVYNL